MPTGIGNRKVLTPRSSKVPRRSLPPQAKLIEAASFDSFDSQPSSPDIMTTKLLEKVKNKKGPSNPADKPSSFNQRLNAAVAMPSNSLAANAGRSKLSTEEFKLDSEEDNEKYNNSKKQSNQPNLTRKHDNHININNNNKNNSNNNNDYNSNNNNHVNNHSFNQSLNQSFNSGSKSTKPQGNNNLYTSNTNTNTDFNGNNSHYNPNNSFDRWNNFNNSNTSTSSINSNSNSSNNNNNNNHNNSYNSGMSSYNSSGESVELLQDQVAHLRREYENLKQRFSELSRLRLSEPEEMLEEERKLSELRDQAAEKTIKALQKENELLKKKNQLSPEKTLEKETSNNPKNYTNSNDDSSPVSSNDGEEFMKEVEKILKIYSSFSGLKITPSPTDGLNQWHCDFSARFGKFAFNLTYEGALNRYQYVPILESTNTNLPAFLTSDILITTDQMQTFFWRLLDTLSKKS